jgi:hypothetical protein
MKPFITSSIAALLIINLAACVSTNPVVKNDKTAITGNIFTTTTDSNEEATTQLVHFLQKNAFDVVRMNETTLRINYDNGKFTLSPKLSEDGLDRIIVRKYYSIQKPYQNTSKILAFVVRLNQELNVAQFSLKDDGQTFVALGNITFVDKLEAVEIRKFMEFFNTGMRAIVHIIPETTDYLE